MKSKLTKINYQNNGLTVVTCKCARVYTLHNPFGTRNFKDHSRPYTPNADKSIWLQTNPT